MITSFYYDKNSSPQLIKLMFIIILSVLALAGAFVAGILVEKKNAAKINAGLDTAKAVTTSVTTAAKDIAANVKKL